MSKHLNPLEKEFLIRQYKSNYRTKMSDFCEANHISTGAFQRWIKQYTLSAVHPAFHDLLTPQAAGSRVPLRTHAIF